MSEKCQKLNRGLRVISRNPLKKWSGRPDSNRRRPAWEAGILPLNYGRPAPPILLLERHGEGLDDLVAPRFPVDPLADSVQIDRKSTRLNSSHQIISYAVFCLKKKKKK